jgi:hypothetical protein
MLSTGVRLTEVAFLHVTTVVLHLELIWHVFKLEDFALQSLFGIVGKKNWEESFELFLKRLFLEKLLERVGIQKFASVWVLVAWHRSASV